MIVEILVKVLAVAVPLALACRTFRFAVLLADDLLNPIGYLVGKALVLMFALFVALTIISLFVPQMLLVSLLLAVMLKGWWLGSRVA